MALTTGVFAGGGAAATGPTISSFTPSGGAPGTAVTISGSNFTGATAVAFNGTAATFTVVSDTQITTSVPAGATSGSITVTTPNGTASSTDGGGQVSFVGAASTSTPAGTTSLAVPLPSGIQAGDLLVAWLSFADNMSAPAGMTGWTAFPWTLDDGTTWHARAYYKIAAAGETAPTATWTTSTKAVFETGAWRGVNTTNPIVASNGALDTTGTTTVTTPSVTNTNAAAWALAFFTFRTTATGGHSATYTGYTPAGLTERTEANLANAASPGWESVATADSAGPIATGAHQFTGATTSTATSTHKGGALIYVNPAGAGGAGSFTVTTPTPTITSFTPTSGTTGTTVTITGTNLSGATAVKFSGTTATYTINSNTQITTTVPTGAGTGPITITTPTGTATSTTSFAVVGAGPAISSFNPAAGPAGTSVTITGSNLTGATVVAFNGTAATYTVNSATQITATAPAGVTSGPITVTTPNGTATSSASFLAGPSITTFSPASGQAGTAVTITGTNFTGATSVKFNGTTATFTVASDTQITTTVPSGATTGTITVGTPNGVATSSGTFTLVGTGQAFVLYAGYNDTHHPDFQKPKPTPWLGSSGVVFVGTPDTSSGGWDRDGLRIDNVSGGTLTNVVVTVDIGSHHWALWGTHSIPAGQSLILAQTGFQNFDGSDESPAGCYGCDPSLCITDVSSTIPVVHVSVNGQPAVNINDSHQVLNTGGVDSAGCPDTGDITIRRDEATLWQQLGSG